MFRTVILSSMLLAMCHFGMSANVIKQMVSNSAKIMLGCKQELGLPDSILMDVLQFLKGNLAAPDRQIGCLVMCLSKGLTVVEETGAFHPGNTKEFAILCGADEDTAAKFASGIDECFKDHASLEDTCLRALQLGICVRDEMEIFKITQDPSVVAAEVASQL